jgi:hypothetical protein
MGKQTYQQVSKVILEELVANPVSFKKVDYHEYFYNLKIKNPEKYERLGFDTNGGTVYCKDLSSIFMDFMICGFMNYDRTPLLKPIKKYLNSKKEK